MFTALIVSALSTWSIVEIFHHGSIFNTLRTTFLKWGQEETNKYKKFVGTLLSCPFCLSVWVGFISILLYYITPIIPIAFASCRIANVLNDILKAKGIGRTPQPDTEKFTIKESEEIQYKTDN